ncbi:MAG: tyrosine--tRNA ligase [Acidimicrobiia bacterium]
MQDATTQQARLLERVDRVEPPSDLLAKLERGIPLRVKLGLDPTAPAVTLGWAVVLRKLRTFQDLGHTAVLIVGDFTARVGDPSGRSETRPRLTAAEVEGYTGAVLSQILSILRPEPLEIRYNSEWLGDLDMGEALELTSKATVAQMLERGDFAKRYEQGIPISVMEFLYPLLQGYDSVAVAADVELGGADQLWNLMMGRVIQERYGMEPQVAMTVPLLVGTDGSQKMSQSLGNYIGITEPADEIFGKTMSIPDHLMESWYLLTTELEQDEVARIGTALRDGSLHPGGAKRRLAREIVSLYQGEDAARAAEERFDVVHRLGAVPDDVSGYPLPDEDPIYLPGVLRDAGLVASGGEGRRLIAQGAVRLTDPDEVLAQEHVERSLLEGRVLKVGKRRFVRLL